MLYDLVGVLAAPLRRAGERGATAVEYGLMVAAISAVIAAIVITLGGDIGGIFTDIDNRFP